VYDLMVIGLLLVLIGLSFYAGYQFALPRVIEAILNTMKDDNIIRLVEEDDGEICIYSGTKFYNGVKDVEKEGVR